MGRRQLIAVDGSKPAQDAFDWFLENFYKQGDTVLLAHCAEYNINMGLPGTHDPKAINAICDAVKIRNDEINALMESFMSVLRSKNIEAKVLLLSGNKPGEAIAKAAGTEGADHIVIGTRGLGKIRRTLLGSVSEYVVHHAECPVTVIRSPSETA